MLCLIHNMDLLFSLYAAILLTMKVIHMSHNYSNTNNMIIIIELEFHEGISSSCHTHVLAPYWQQIGRFLYNKTAPKLKTVVRKCCTKQANHNICGLGFEWSLDYGCNSALLPNCLSFIHNWPCLWSILWYSFVQLRNITNYYRNPKASIILVLRSQSPNL